jgi:hypothetical protein
MDSLEICCEYLNFSCFKGVGGHGRTTDFCGDIMRVHTRKFYLVSDKIQIQRTFAVYKILPTKRSPFREGFLHNLVYITFPVPLFVKDKFKTHNTTPLIH